MYPPSFKHDGSVYILFEPLDRLLTKDKGITDSMRGGDPRYSRRNDNHCNGRDDSPGNLYRAIKSTSSWLSRGDMTWKMRNQRHASEPFESRLMMDIDINKQLIPHRPRKDGIY
jgi:hypothetical protein